MKLPAEWLMPDWDAPPTVNSFITTRHGGVSKGVYSSMNLGTRVEDDPEAVRCNRSIVNRHLPATPLWLQQVHGSRVVDSSEWQPGIEADAIVTRDCDRVCVIMMADCMPVLFCSNTSTVVAAAHAGWRGLAAGVLENTIVAMQAPPASMNAYLGPAIGASVFEVGDDVYERFCRQDETARASFVVHGPGKWLCDLYALARARLQRAGVARVWGGEYCTYSDTTRFFSHRRDRVSGRMAAFIWRSEAVT